MSLPQRDSQQFTGKRKNIPKFKTFLRTKNQQKKVSGCVEEQLLSLVGSLSLGQANSGQHAVGWQAIIMPSEMEVAPLEAKSGWKLHLPLICFHTHCNALGVPSQFPKLLSL